MEDDICESYECGFDEYLEVTRFMSQKCSDFENLRNNKQTLGESISAFRQQMLVPNYQPTDNSYNLEDERFLEIEKDLEINEVEEKEERDLHRTKTVTKNSHNFEIDSGFQKNANLSTADSFSLISSTNSYVLDTIMSQSQHPWRHQYYNQQWQSGGRQQQQTDLPFCQAELEDDQKSLENDMFSDVPLDRIHEENQVLLRQGSYILQVTRDFEIEKKNYTIIHKNVTYPVCNSLPSPSAPSSSERQGLDQIDCSVLDSSESNDKFTGEGQQNTQQQSLDEEKKSLIESQVSYLTEGRLIAKDIHPQSNQKILLGEIELNNNKSNNSNTQGGFRRIHSVTETIFGVSVEYGSCQSLCEFIPEENIEEFLMENSQSSNGELLQEQLKLIMDYQMRMMSLRDMIPIDLKVENISKVIKSGELLLKKIEKSSNKKESQMYEYQIVRVINGIPSVLSQGMSNGLISAVGLGRNTFAQQLLRTNDWPLKIDETKVQSVIRNIQLNLNRWSQYGQQNNNTQKRQQNINVIDQAFQAQISSSVYQITPQQSQNSLYPQVQVIDYLCIDSYSELSAKIHETMQLQSAVYDETSQQLDQSQSMNNSQDSLEDFLKDIQSSSITQTPRVSSGIMKKSIRSYYSASKVIVDKYYKTYSESQRLQQQINRLLNKRNHKYK